MGEGAYLQSKATVMHSSTSHNLQSTSGVTLSTTLGTLPRLYLTASTALHQVTSMTHSSTLHQTQIQSQDQHLDLLTRLRRKTSSSTTTSPTSQKVRIQHQVVQIQYGRKVMTTLHPKLHATRQAEQSNLVLEVRAEALQQYQ